MGFEEATGRVNGDALILFIFQGIKQECIFERARITAAAFFYAFQLPLGKRAGICQ